MNLKPLLKRETLRRVELIEALYYSPNPLSSEYLVSLLHCSLPALLNDIKVINDHYGELSIIKQKGLYELDLADCVGLDHLYAYIISSSYEMRLLEQLLYENHQTIVDLADFLFISASNVHRYLNNLRKILQNWQIQIKHRPLRLEGDEAAIRHLYYLFFNQKKAAVEDFFNPELAEAVQCLIDEVIICNQIPKTLALNTRLSYSFFVSLWRVKNQHYFPAELLDSNCFQKVAPETLRICKKQLENWQIPFYDREYRECLWLFYSDNLLMTPELFKKAIQTNSRIEDLYEMHQFLLTELANHTKTPLPKQEADELIRMFLNAHALFGKNMDFILVLNDLKRTFTQTVEPLRFHSIQKLRQVIKKFTENYQIYQTEDFLINYLYLIVTCYPECLDLMEAQEPQLDILLISDLTPTQELFLAEFIKKNVAGNFSLHLSHEMDWKRDLKSTIEPYDIVITTVTFPERNTEVPILAVECHPSIKSYLKIQKTVHYASSKKKQLDA